MRMSTRPRSKVLSDLQNNYSEQIYKIDPNPRGAKDIRRAMTDLVATAFFPVREPLALPAGDPLLDAGQVIAFSMYRKYEGPRTRGAGPSQRIYFSRHRVISDVPGRVMVGGDNHGTTGLSDLAIRPLESPQQARALPGKELHLWKIGLIMDWAVQDVARNWLNGNFSRGVELVSRFRWPKIRIGFQVDDLRNVPLTDAIKAAAVEWARSGGAGQTAFLRAQEAGYVMDVSGLEAAESASDTVNLTEYPGNAVPAVQILFSDVADGSGKVWAMEFPRRGFVPHPLLRPGTHYETGAQLGTFLGKIRPRDWDDLCWMAGEHEASWLCRSLVRSSDIHRPDRSGATGGMNFRWAEYLEADDMPTFDPTTHTTSRPRALDFTDLTVRDDDTGAVWPIVQVALGDPRDLLVHEGRVETFDLWNVPPQLAQFRAVRRSLFTNDT